MTSEHDASRLLDEMIGHRVVLDLRASYVCLGTLVGWDRTFFDLTDADLHDLRDSQGTRELYVYESARMGIRRNRARALVRRDEVVAITRLDQIAES